jgi:hypothetical protein
MVKLDPTHEVGTIATNDEIVLDGERFTVVSITETGLVHLRDSSGNRVKYGAAELNIEIANTHSVIIRRISDVSVSKVSEVEYHASLLLFEIDNKNLAAFLTIPVEAEQYYLYDDGNAGFGITEDGELVGLFNGSNKSGVGRRMIDIAIRKGADNLFCFDTKLTDLYKERGFVETSRAGWDEDMAPENWDYDRFGKPDVVWMELDR